MNASDENRFIVFVVGGTEIWALKSTFISNPRGKASRFAKELPVFAASGMLHEAISHQFASSHFYDKSTSHHRPDLVEVVYYFEEHDPSVFKDILYYIQTGHLHVSNALCPQFFKEEMAFWGIKCHSETQKCACANDIVSKSSLFGHLIPMSVDVADVNICDRGTPWKRKYEYIKNTVWLAMENQEFTNSSLFLFTVSNLIILVNIIIIIMDSFPANHWSDMIDGLGRPVPIENSKDSAPMVSSISKTGIGILLNSTTTTYPYSQHKSRFKDGLIEITNATQHDNFPTTTLTTQEAYQFWCVDWLCNAWFTLEIILKLFSAPRRNELLKDMMFIIDVLAVVPSYVAMLMTTVTGNRIESNYTKMFKILRTLRTLRILRILKLARLDNSFRVLPVIFRKILPDFLVFCALLSVTTLMLATAIYYVEVDMPKTAFSNIPIGVFWAIASSYTFSDCPPESHIGKIISSAGAIVGIIIMALPILFIIKSFTETFKAFQKEQEEVKKKTLRDSNTFYN